MESAEAGANQRNREIAEIMANREMARLAFDSVDTNSLPQGESSPLDARADSAAKLGAISLSAEDLAAVPKPGQVDPEIIKKVEGVVVNQVDLHAYALAKQFEPTDHGNRSFTSHLWSRLINLNNAEKHKNFGGEWYYKTPLLPVVRLKFNRETPSQEQTISDNLGDLQLASLIDFLADYDNFQAENKHLKPTAILGSGFGPKNVKFLREYVQFKLRNLDCLDVNPT